MLSCASLSDEDTTVDDSAVEDAAVDNVGVDDTAMFDAAVDDTTGDDVAVDAAVEAFIVFEDLNEDRTVVVFSLKACDSDEDCVVDVTCAGNCVIVNIPDGCLITSSVFCHLLSAVLLFGTFVPISVSKRF